MPSTKTGLRARFLCMTFFRRFHSIQGSLLLHELSFLLLILVTAVVAVGWGFAWQKSAEESMRLTTMNSHTQAIRSEVYRQLKEVFDASFLHDKYASDEYALYLERINAHLLDLDRIAGSPSERQAISRISQAYDAFHQQTYRLLAEQALNEQHKQLLDQQLEQYTFPALEIAFIRFEKVLMHRQQLLMLSRESWKWQILLVVVIPIVIAISFLIYARRFVRKKLAEPMAEVIQGADWISSGDFSHQIPEAGLNEISKLAQAINTMAAELRLQRERLAVSAQAAKSRQTDSNDAE